MTCGTKSKPRQIVEYTNVLSDGNNSRFDEKSIAEKYLEDLRASLHGQQGLQAEMTGEGLRVYLH